MFWAADSCLFVVAFEEEEVGRRGKRGGQIEIGESREEVTLGGGN